ncbi:MAG: DUF3368 domain-containing protein [Plectolyngbya sp. WJT66-NPBG17]|jgi:predicted nucleic acid-binding protein|nr:DUF3368 domain-containing protein [Plectolyngbya sp. WJT66-NPBG17]
MSIVSDTSSINYLILIGQIDLLPALFKQIVIPEAVYDELSDSAAPQLVQDWISNIPCWLTVCSVTQPGEKIVDQLDPGEHAAILLAQQLSGDLILLDDMKARRVAMGRGFAITGILGILDQIDLPDTVQNTSFWASDALFQKLLDRHL